MTMAVEPKLQFEIVIRQSNLAAKVALLEVVLVTTTCLLLTILLFSSFH